MSGNPLNIVIDGLDITGDLVLAPMDGYTSWPFRSLCRELGSAISYTEFVKAEDVLQRPHYIREKIHFTESERPIFIQIYGNNPETIVEAAQQLQEAGPDAIDINMGCPNRSIAGRGAGAGLMRTPKKAARIMKTLKSTLEVPVTAKIRLGWQDCQNGLLLARGDPDLAALAEIKETLSIPVLGNGGILTTHDIQSMKNATGCDGVMIGRGAVENPWIFSRRMREDIKPIEVQELLLEHLERSLSFYGPENGLVLFRKFAAGYLKPYALDRETRRELLTEVDAGKFKSLVREIIIKIIGESA